MNLFQFQKYNHYPKTDDPRRKYSNILPQQRHRHNHGQGLQITETHPGESIPKDDSKVPSDYLMSSIGGVIATDHNNKPFILIHPNQEDDSYESTFVFSIFEFLISHV